MTEPLEVTLKFGQKTHHIVIKEGDADAAADAKQSIESIIDLFAGSSDKKRVQPKTPTIAPKTTLAPAVPATEKSTGVAK